MRSLIAGIRRPQYTGENRCVQCTVVNTAIAVLLAVAVVAAGSQIWSPTGGFVAGATVLLGSAAAIWFRGYLVPGTPALTKRYFPDRMLGWFGKAGTEGAANSDGTGGPSARDIDPETELVQAGALEACQRGEDLCVTDDFRRAWYEAIERVEAEDAGRERLLEVLDLGGADVEFQDHGAAFSARVDDGRVGTWESRPAFLADVGAATVLADRLDGWDDLPVGHRSTLLSGLRLFIDECPGCGGTPAFGTETVESCCSTHEVAAVECPDCDARLFESNPI